ncbi:MAG: hypothetical protein LUG91_00220 [Ruminococcus sp.]|nr:hypothetical protein [Ruminococcus sp.]
MARRNKTTSERGKFKEEIHAALYKSDDIRKLLLNDTSGMSASKIREEFKNHVKSHLFIDDTIEETDSFIYYDVTMPYLEPNIKGCRVIMYVICHRDILDNYYAEGYYGNRADILSEMIEDVLINDEKVANSFGIGELTLDSVDIYNSTRFYGCIMTFNVPTFR